ncbi:MAG: polysaccharide deacetylase family protein [Armatimonadota bacterium]
MLLYHRVGLPRLSSLVPGQYVTPMLLRAQLDYLAARGWFATSLAQVVRGLAAGEPAAHSQFAVTFDDAYRGVYERAYPIMVERGISATVFVVAGHIGGTNDWDTAAGDCREPLMTAEQIRRMSDAGFEIGSHTMTHPRLTELSDADLNRELSDSKHVLEDLIGREVVAFSYPYGAYDYRVLAAVEAAGYRCAVGTRLGAAGSSGVYEIPRINVRWNSLGPLLMRKINRAAAASAFVP